MLTIPSPNPRRQAAIKAALFVLAAMPLVRLIVATLTDRLGANPLEFITRNTGDWTLYMLCITLAVTPLRRLLNQAWLARLRRMFGLYTYFYAALHFLCFFWFDHFFDITEMLKDVARRPFILVGFLAFVLLTPLALTSTNRMIRLVGAARWQLLHKLVYLIAGLGLLHYFWMKAGKHDFAQPLLFAVLIATLLGARVGWALQARVRQRTL